MTKESRHRYFPVNIAKFLLLPILKNICKWLLFNLFNGSLLHDFRVPFLVSCCQFIKTITLKALMKSFYLCQLKARQIYFM